MPTTASIGADPGWRARTARGAVWLHRSVLAAPLLVLPGLVGAAAALWLLTTPEPGRAETGRARSIRRSARGAAVAAAATGLAVVVVALWKHGSALASALFGPDGGPPGIAAILKLQRDVAAMSSGWDALDLLLSLAAASLAVALLEALRHLYILAARAEDPAAAERCRQTWRAYLIGGGLLAVLALLTTLGNGLELGPAQPLVRVDRGDPGRGGRARAAGDLVDHPAADPRTGPGAGTHRGRRILARGGVNGGARRQSAPDLLAPVHGFSSWEGEAAAEPSAASKARREPRPPIEQKAADPCGSAAYCDCKFQSLNWSFT